MSSAPPPDVEMRPLTADEFDQFRRLAYDQFGLDLREGKEQLVSARLNKKMRELKLRTYKDYYRYVVEDTTGAALVSLIDALTTNHTSFYREQGHFDFYRTTILPELASREQISIWSAASSTGEEPYTIAFTTLEQLGMGALPKVKILATDISTRVLETARNGAYPSEKLRDFPPEQLRKYMLRGDRNWKDWYQVRKEIRAAVTFTRLNLMEPFRHGQTFPLIFCRNVMIYFDRPTQQDLVRRLAACLEPGGYLFIGHAESLNGLDVPVKYVKPAVYRRLDGTRTSSTQGLTK